MTRENPMTRVNLMTRLHAKSIRFILLQDVYPMIRESPMARESPMTRFSSFFVKIETYIYATGGLI